MKRTGLLLTLTYLFAGGMSHAQMPGMKVYAESDGYPATTGYIINQDSAGFIWIGSNKGAIRYDGHSFKVFDERDGLLDKEVIEAVPGLQNTVLITPLVNNLSYYKKGKIFNENTDLNLGQVHNTSQNIVLPDYATGNCWVGDWRNTGGVYHFSGAKQEWIEIPLQGEFDIIAAHNNKLVIKQANTLQLYSKDLGTIEPFIVKGNPDYFSSGSLLSFTRDHKYVVGYSSKDQKIGVYQIKNSTELQFLTSAPAGHLPKQMIIDQKNRLWFTFRDAGVLFWGAVPVITSQTRPIPMVPETVVNHVFSDRNDNLWFTTKRKGLYFIPASQWTNHLRSKKTGLPGYIPIIIRGDKHGRIYIAYEGHNALGVIEHSHYEEIPLKEGNSEGLKGLLCANNMLYAHTSNKLYTIQLNSENQSINSGISCTPFGVIKDLYMTRDSTQVRVASSSGLFTFLPGPDQKLINNGFHKRTTAVLSLGYKNLVGTPNGLYLGPVSGKSYRLTYHKVLSRANITDMVMIDKRNCLIATASDGLFTYDVISDSIFKPEVSPGSYLGYIHEVFRESESVFWLATDQGVFNFLLKKGFLQKLGHYTFRDGLPSDNTTSVWVTGNTIYTATSAGLAILNRQPVSHFGNTRVSVLSATANDSTIFFPTKLSFKYPTPNISLQLSSFSFEHIGQTSYRYTLEGNGPAWFISRNPMVYFNDLSPGEYTFRVRAISPEGKSEGSPTIVPLVIHPAYWQTIWFKLLIGLLATGLFTGTLYFSLFRQRQRSYRKLQQKRKLAELELEAIKAQINPHFIFNCLNSIQLFTYRGDVENAQQYLDRFSLLIRQTMKLSQQRFTTVQEEVQYLSNYLQLEKMRFKDQLEYHLDVQENINPLRLLPAMLLQPYIENALKHGIAHNPEKGELLISMQETHDNQLEVHIYDNGPGFHQKSAIRESNGLGMRLSGSRMNTYNELFQLHIQLDIQSPPEDPEYGHKGTLIKIVIPTISHEKIKV